MYVCLSAEIHGYVYVWGSLNVCVWELCLYVYTCRFNYIDHVCGCLYISTCVCVGLNVYI